MFSSVNDIVEEQAEKIAELKQALADLLYTTTYDFENCDFGPSYGINRDREKQAVANAKRLANGIEPSWFKETQKPKKKRPSQARGVHPTGCDMHGIFGD